VPSGPKRLKISLGGLAGGLALGAALAFFMDIRNRSFHSEKELKRHFDAPLVIGVPLMMTSREELGLKRKHIYEWLGGVAMFIMVVAAELFVFLHG
jgi:hypothetical protein